MLRRIWLSDPPDGVDLHFQSRTKLRGSNAHQWSPGQPADRLPACDTVIALWGQTAGDAEALSLNPALAGESRAVALTCGASRLLHISSAAVYGPAEHADEETPTAPINAYGQSKLALEMRVAGFDDPSLAHTCLRLANVVGADSLAPALTGTEPVTLDRFEDGQGPLRSYVGARDLAEILIMMVRVPPSDLPATLNIAAHTPISMQALATAADKEILWRRASTSAVQRVTLDTTRLAQLLPDLHLTTEADTLIEQWHQHRDPA
ncbi:NAD(P)-dependent oxidoreductase [uncultured Roseovarius sp.]|uniref:NAD-dependent epimerase/dehydratase family protein n=1 Tax=uncultured Roseovarius sp. TaxID=293344 RepID=UPI002603130D|nr:SDR family oxidoreductase [uncultured Roseovarius sp.]